MSTAAPIVLIGLRGVGKSTVGPLLARELGVGFVDLDECIQFAVATECCNLHAPTIAELVRAHGWEEFRDRESAELERVLADGETRVIAAGGGVVERETNRLRLRERTRAVWLREDLNVLAARLFGDASRPALTDLPLRAELEEVAARRAAWYAETARWTVDVEQRDPREVARTIAALVASAPREKPHEA